MPSYFITMGGTLCTRVTSLPSTDVIKPHHLTNVSSNGSNPQPPLPPFGPSRMPTSGSSRLSLNPSSWQRSVSSISRQNYPANVAKKLPRIPRACSGEGQEGSGQKAGATSVSSDSESLPPNPSPSSTSPLDTSPSDPLSVCVMRTAILTCPGHVADALMDALLSLGASTCSIEDANTGTEAEQEIYSSGPIPWDPSGPRSLWNQVKDSTQGVLSSQSERGGHPQHCCAGGSCSAVGGGRVGGGGRWGGRRRRGGGGGGEEVVSLLGVEEVVERDWVQQVQDSFHPIRVDEGLWIVPSWATLPDEPIQNNSLAITLEPGLAFGTGDHPTTRLCLRWLRSVVTPGSTLLDYGTGSGILAIAGIKLGAAAAVGVDIDELSVAAAAHNASLNSIPPSQFTVLLTHPDGPDPLNEFDNSEARETNATESKLADGVTVPALPAELTAFDSSAPLVQFDVVAANILVNPLILLAERISSRTKPGGRLGLSGILTNQVDSVVTAYVPYATVISVEEEDGWALVYLQRNH
ncbi:hypothetical protein CLOP_g20140 [Closterium sp. NIES-67]|nr:hypothetical protein CLOP_g20140 [Closterium sp. NIES-67]